MSYDLYTLSIRIKVSVMIMALIMALTVGFNPTNWRCLPAARSRVPRNAMFLRLRQGVALGTQGRSTYAAVFIGCRP